MFLSAWNYGANGEMARNGAENTGGGAKLEGLISTGNEGQGECSTPGVTGLHS